MESSENEKKEDHKRCGSSHCCCSKLFIAFLLLLIGGILGYLIGKCSMSRCYYGRGMVCMTSQSGPATGVSAPVEKTK